MKKIRCLLGLSLIILWLMFWLNQNANARRFANNPCYMNATANTPNNQWNWVERWINEWKDLLVWNSDWTYTYKYTDTPNVWQYTNLKSWNMWDYFACNLDYYSSSVNWRRQSNYNFIKVFKPCNLWECSYEFYYWNEYTKNYKKFTTSWLWYSDTDGNIYDMWFPWHGTIVLYSSETRHTIQLIWRNAIKDRIVYFDPLEPDQNLWVISFIQNKAWSLHQQSDFDYYLFWMWSDNETMFSDLLFEYSYTIQDNWQFFRPDTAWQLNIWPTSPSNGGRIWRYTEVAQMWLTFIYTTDLIFDQPDWWYTWPIFWWSWVSIPSDEVWKTTWQQCSSKVENLRKYVQLMYYCWVWDWSEMNHIFYSTWDYIYTWSNNSCKDFSSYHNKIIVMYHDNWNYWNIKLVDLYSINESKFNDLAYSWFDTSVYEDENHYIQWLPSQNACAIYTTDVVSNTDNECNLSSWANIINCFSFWSNKYGSWDTTYFWMAINNVKSLIWDSFMAELVSPIEKEYNKWKNLIKRWLVCDPENMYIIIPHIDYVVWVLALIVFLILFSII